MSSGRIARAARSIHSRDRMAGHLARRLDHLTDGIALSIAQVVGPAALIQSAQGQDVGLGQVKHMDIVAHAGAVGGGVVGSEYVDCRSIARCSKCKRDQVGFRSVVFPQLPFRIRTGGVEIP